MGDGSVEACAVKSLQYGSPEERGHAHSELQALRMARGVPHVVQGLAAFPYRCLDNNQDVLMLAMRWESFSTASGVRALVMGSKAVTNGDS